MAGNQKFCPNCGTPSSVEAVFCLSCGSKFPAFTPQGESATTTAPAQAPVSAPVVPPLPREPRSDFITLACPNCGGKLEITPDVERFACQFCGHEHIVRRNDGAISLEPVMQVMGQISNNINQVGSGIHRISGSAEKQASETAIIRLKDEIAAIQKKIEQTYVLTRNVWFGALGAGGVAFFGWIGGYAEDGVSSSLERSLKTLGGIATAITILVLIAAISCSVSDHKREKEQQEVIRRKQEELGYHYRIVSGQ